jgi:hypothetical protein
MKSLVAWAALGLATLLSAGSASASVMFTDTFDTPPDLSIWKTDRRAPAQFENEVFDGDSRLNIGIAGSDFSSNTFYNTQGRQRLLYNIAPTYIAGDLYIGEDWQTQRRRSDIWGIATDAADTNLTGGAIAYPIFGFVNNDPSNPVAGTQNLVGRFRVWDADTATGWVDLGLPSDFAYGEWYNLKICFTGSAFEYYLNNLLVYTDLTTGREGYTSTQFRGMIMQGYNFGESYDIYWDNVSAGDCAPAVPEPATLTLIGLGLGALAIRRKRR